MAFTIEWDKSGEKRFENGLDRGVIYTVSGNGYSNGVAWNGLTSVSESPEGAEANDMYADNIKYASLRSAETFKGTIEAYTYPDEFAECDGSASISDGVYIGQQSRKKFAFSYRTKIGDDLDPEKGYKIHIAYGCSVTPSEKSYETVNDSPEAITFSWEFDTTPVNVTGYKPTATLIIDSTKVSPTALTDIENKLYGTGSNGGTVLLPDEVANIISRTA